MRTSRNAGFTLIELMIVVAIVAILAVIAAVGYRTIINSSKVSEPRQFLGAIRMAQEAYKAETGSYTTAGSAAGLCPSNGSTGLKVGWNPGCGTPVWSNLPVAPDGAVLFGYATVSGTFGGVFTASPMVSGISIGPASPGGSGAGYWAYAEGNPGSGTTKLLASSLTKDIFIDEP